MRKDDLERLWGRIQRYAEEARTRVGPGIAYSATLSGERVQQYEITNVRDLSNLEHDAATWVVWIWSFKDYIRAEADKTGRSPDWWRGHVLNSGALQLAADIANREKHGGVARAPWTPHEPRLGNATASIPQEAVSSLMVLEGSIRINTADPTLVEYSIPILDKNGVVLGNALEVFSVAMDDWDEALSELREAV